MNLNSTNAEFIGGPIWMTINSLIVLAILFGNTLTIIVALFHNRSLSSTVSNRFICSLACSDLAVGLSLPYNMCFYTQSSLLTNKWMCLVRCVLVLFVCSGSIIKLLFVTVDRYIAILHPLRYAAIMTQTTITCIICSNWLLALILASVPLYWNNWHIVGWCDPEKVVPPEYYNFFLTPLFLLMWIVMLTVYWKICKEARSHARRSLEMGNVAVGNMKSIQVGLSFSYHMCFYLVKRFSEERCFCIARFVLVTFSCSSSICNIFVVAADRYAAVVYPLSYARTVTRSRAIAVTLLGWTIALSISTVPIFWNQWREGASCDIGVLPEEYFNYVLTPPFVVVWGMMLVVYVRIWREAVDHAKRIRNATPYSPTNVNDTKSMQVVMLTLGCFSICWMPYFIVTTYYRINKTSGTNFSLTYEISFTMAIANSCMNPVIYAWKNTNFREAFLCLLKCTSPNKGPNKTLYITNHVPGKRSSSSVNGSTNAVDFHIKNVEDNETSVANSVATEMTNVGNDSIERT